ncbi:predicted protein [Coccidioides posadasii str. Silveira]|uniref:Predicted protein n=1 Tax=Coccidioides posadasii (strain RMSCC 757 / Silveira) TaxID=443226 RepID=E9CVJ8_COCPS|nr:predicted protein [Coccidioides posadasii str. Silveira]
MENGGVKQNKNNVNAAPKYSSYSSRATPYIWSLGAVQSVPGVQLQQDKVKVPQETFIMPPASTTGDCIMTPAFFALFWMDSSFGKVSKPLPMCRILIGGL